MRCRLNCIIDVMLAMIISVGAISNMNIQSAPPLHHTYLDVTPLNTSKCLETIYMLNVSSYRLPFDRTKSSRLRLGVIGPQVPNLIPDAVEIMPKRVLPPEERNGNPLIMYDVPVINENTIFMYGVGATQELIKKVKSLEALVEKHMEKVAMIHGEAAKLEYILTQVPDKDADLRMRAALAEAEASKTDLELEKKKAEEEEVHLQVQKDIEIETIRRNEEVDFKRISREEEISKLRSKEELRMRYELALANEKMKRDTSEAISLVQHERNLALQNAKEQAKARTAQAIAQAKAQAERSNEDVHIRKLKEEAVQSRKKSIAAINAIATHIGSGLLSASQNPKKVFTFVMYVALLTTGIFTAKELARMFRLLIESTIGKPKLIRETTRRSLLRQWMDAITATLSIPFYPHVECGAHLSRSFDDVILDESLKDKILSIATSASKVRENKAPHRHILLYGPPGTGKTMVAKKLASCIGLDYALMSGGDVGPLGSDAVTQIHNLFRWAKMSRKGVLLFIDEAECFLSDRKKNCLTENAHNALNALLYNTGSERTDFMMVLATNRAEDLDSAILDRCDESILFPLPDDRCRKQLLHVYYQKYVRSLERNDKLNKSLLQGMIHRIIKNRDGSFRPVIESNVMNENQLNSIVSLTAGFSGREIAKLMIGIQGGIYSSKNATLTSDTVDMIVKSKVKDHKNKMLISGRCALTVGAEDVDLSFSSMEFSENGSSEAAAANAVDSSLDKSLLQRATGGVSLEEVESLTT